MDILRKYDKNTVVLISFLAVLVIVLLISGIIMDFIDEFFIAPVLADAGEDSSSRPGYNLYSTIGYGFILAGAVYLIYRFMEKKEIEYGRAYLLATIPYVVLGALWRVLEDSELFEYPGNVFFISPVIYVILGLLALFYLFLSHYSIHSKKFGDYALILGCLELIILPLLLFGDAVAAYPAIVGIVVAIGIFPLLKLNTVWKKFPVEEKDLGAWRFGIFGKAWLVMALYYYMVWAFDRPWSTYHAGREWVIPFAIFIAVLWAGLYYGISFLSDKLKREDMGWLRGLRRPSNLLLVFSQYLDGTATFIGIDFFSYTEKHVLPAALMEVFDTGAVMFILKTMVVVLVLYVIEKLYVEDLKEHPSLVNLLRLAVIVLGLATGLRDALRIGMGV